MQKNQVSNAAEKIGILLNWILRGISPLNDELWSCAGACHFFFGRRSRNSRRQIRLYTEDKTSNPIWNDNKSYDDGCTTRADREGREEKKKKTSRRLNLKRYVCIGPLDEAQSILYRAHVPLSFASHPIAGCLSLDFCNDKAKAEKIHVDKYHSTVSFSCYSFFFEF